MFQPPASVPATAYMVPLPSALSVSTLTLVMVLLLAPMV